MSLRAILLDPLLLPDQTIQPARITAVLVDANDTSVQLLGQLAPDGTPVSGGADARIRDTAVTIHLTPQTEIAPASVYLFRVRVGDVDETFKAAIPAGAEALTWPELLDLGDPLDPADLSALALHLSDDDRHLLADERAALSAAASPNAGNPLATIADVTGGGLPSAEAEEAIVPGQPIRLTAAGLAALADATVVGRAEVAGIAAAAAGAGFAVPYARTRVAVPDWTAITGSAALTPGAIYYLDPAAPGRLSTTAPESAGQYATRVGRGASADTLQIEIEPPIFLGA